MRAAIDRMMASAGIGFMDAWAVLERAYRRPLAWISQRLRFAFYPLLAVLMLGWLGWDMQHARSLDAAEDAVFDRIIGWRPIEPVPGGRTVVVEIDDCSIDYYRARGEGGWPWSRERHADLLEALDRAGVRAVGIDVLFADRAPADPAGDALLEAMAAAGDGRFVFAASRMHRDFDPLATLHAAEAPGAVRRVADAATPGPAVALVQPYGAAMARHSGLVNIERGRDGVLRDVRLYEPAGDWAIPAMTLRLAQAAGAETTAAVAARGGALRINWRERSRLPYASAADLLEGVPVCGSGLPPLRDAVAVIGHTAAGINDSKPTPVDMAMPGVEILAEATEALLTGSWIRMPPGWLKYALAAILVLLSCFVFWRGEPHQDVDPVFVALNLVLLAVAFVGLTLFGWFIDIFASLAFGALCFGLCRGYAAVQRGRAIGNSDYLREYDPATRPWLLLARLRFEPDPSLSPQRAKRARREYRRTLRRLVHSSDRIVLIEGVIERKHWMHALLDDLVLLTWAAESEAAARAMAQADLDALHALLNAGGERLDGIGRVMACVATTAIEDRTVEGIQGARHRRLRLRALLGQDLDRLPHWPLAKHNNWIHKNPLPEEGTPCETRSDP
ncbi:CHASE2 domain-containing protein [Luteimonas sp. MJ250]|uniref:CHASE2 domain-containing protein n=1 Tax=Luteimonas sp. MJ250 TaxID=3129236 RepID=UPI0031B9DEE5